MGNIISKEDFISCLEDIKNVIQYHKDLNNFLSKHDVDGYMYQPDCVCNTIKVLHLMFGVADKDDYIEHFCYDTCFGKKQFPGLFLDSKGKNVEVKSSEELYDLLISLT